MLVRETGNHLYELELVPAPYVFVDTNEQRVFLKVSYYIEREEVTPTFSLANVPHSTRLKFSTLTAVFKFHSAFLLEREGRFLSPSHYPSNESRSKPPVGLLVGF